MCIIRPQVFKWQFFNGENLHSPAAEKVWLAARPLAWPFFARSGVQPDFVMYNSVMNICEQLGRDVSDVLVSRHPRNTGSFTCTEQVTCRGLPSQSWIIVESWGHFCKNP